MNQQLVRKTGVQQRTEVSFAVPSRTRTAYFNGFKINACEIHENFHRKPNAMHRPVIHQSVKPLHRDVVDPTIPYDFTQKDETGRVLL